MYSREEWVRQHLTAPRAAPRMMTTEELTATVWRFLAPPWISCGVSVNSRRLREVRDRMGFDDAGALWIASGSRRVFPGIAVPIGPIPYETMIPRYDDRKLRYVGGRVKAGWRQILDRLWRAGYLRNDPELLFLIGRAAP